MGEIIKKIFKKLTPRKVKKELESFQRVKFSPSLQKWMKEYAKVGERDDFVFKWCYKMNTKWILVDSVPQKYRQSLAEVKTLFNMFLVLLDDMAEKQEKEKLLNELLKIPFYEKYIDIQKLNKKEKKYLNFSMKVWHQIIKTIKRYPRYKEVKEIFDFDVFQFLEAVRYGFFICKDPYRINELEYWTFFPHSMQILIDADIDLMCTPRFDLKEIGRFREIVLLAQRMGRIGNWITTWEREIKQGDLTSGVFPYILNQNIMNIHELQLKDNKDEVIKKIKNSKAENYLLKRWEEYYVKIIKASLKIRSINIKKFLKKFEYLLLMHLISRGFK